MQDSSPVDDLGLVDGEAVVVGGVEAGGLAGCALHVDHRAAGSAHEVVVVVAELQLEARGMSRGLELAHEADARERREDVVDGLGAHGAESLPRAAGDGVDIGVGVRGQLAEHRDPGCGDAQGVLPQEACGCVRGDHRAHR